jgi:hypothetical protein
VFSIIMRHRRRSHRLALWACAALCGAGLTACALSKDDTATSDHTNHAGSSSEVVSVAGWTRIATTPSYIVIANVLPGEEMFTADEVAMEHPLEGELTLLGPGEPIGGDARHVETHIYDRTTGLPLSDVDVTLVVTNRTTGEVLTVSPTLMQDVNIGPLDIHFGNNTQIPSSSNLSLTVKVDDEEVTVDGFLL